MRSALVVGTPSAFASVAAKKKVSAPAPPDNMSMPPPPCSWSLPAPPSSMSLPPPPHTVSLPPRATRISLPSAAASALSLVVPPFSVSPPAVPTSVLLLCYRRSDRQGGRADLHRLRVDGAEDGDSIMTSRQAQMRVLEIVVDDGIPGAATEGEAGCRRRCRLKKF